MAHSSGLGFSDARIGAPKRERSTRSSVRDSPQILKFRSTDAAEVVETWNTFAPSSELKQVDETRCEFDWVSVSTPALSVIRYELAAGVRSSIEPEDQLFSCRVTTGDGGCESDRRELRPDEPWASAGQPIRARWEDRATVRALAFERTHAEQLARQISGDDTLRLEVKDPETISTEAGQQWDLAFRYLASGLMALGSAGPGSGAELATAGLERHALWTVLTTFPSTLSDAMQRTAQTGSAPKTVRLALSYIDAHAHLPITVDDVAIAARISTRGLQYAFKRALGFSPRDYLRRARLAGARGELLRAVPGDTLSGIAQRWGFTNVSRFTVAYRTEFDEHPAEMLLQRTR